MVRASVASSAISPYYWASASSMSRRTSTPSSRADGEEKTPANGGRFSLATWVTIIFMAAGVVMPLVTQTGANPNLMVLSLGAGSLMFSHVNDSGFWMFKEYFNLSIKDTICSWSIMETIVSVVGLIGVMILNMIV